MLDPKKVAAEVTAIRDQDNWPMWPVLPVKTVASAKTREYGIILAGDMTTVWFVNIYELKAGAIAPQLEGRHSITFDSVEEMVTAGWIGD